MEPAIVNIAEAKLSSLIERALAGEFVVFARSGKPMVRPVPAEDLGPPPFGLCKHWQIPDDLFLEPKSEKDLAAAAGAVTDEVGITRPYVLASCKTAGKG